ncbi:glycoside hydrolase family 108 protein [Pseudovibrio brasiliensis]|uniref:glycoside hydrolase family 108 protein n=1 Tax=Pseudovibrio brasiliensis TaxID=1898042 RepID=UPI000B27601E|nr:glycoside hydrolase family 108 protein [Pseudovibrio brasiliensis]
MLETFEQILSDLEESEGGFVHRSRKADPGGATNLGITQATLSAARGYQVSIEDVKNLGLEEANCIYKAQYWDAVRADDLPSGLDYCVFDFAVNSGPSRAAKTLQKILGVKADGFIGLQTLNAVQSFSVQVLVNKLSEARLAFMKRLRNWQHNKNGWTSRVRRVQERSLELADTSATKLVPPLRAPVTVDKGAKALDQETKALSVWLTPEGLSKAIPAASGLAGMLVGSGPLQWALSLVLVAGVAYAGYLMLKKERAG